MQVYTAAFQAVAAAAAQDLWQIQAPSVKSIVLLRWKLGQSNIVSPNEYWRISCKRYSGGTPTSGSGGTTPTASPVGGGPAYGGTVKSNNTTRFSQSGGTQELLWEEAMSILSGDDVVSTPQEQVEAFGAAYLVIGLESTPAASSTISGTVTFAVVG